MANLHNRDVVRRLREIHGYSRLEAEGTMRDVLSVLQELLEDLEAGEHLTLGHVGRFDCRVRFRADGTPCQTLVWQPSQSLDQLGKGRTLPVNDPRVILARGKHSRRFWR